MFLNADFRPGPAMALPGLSRSTDDLFYSDPSLRWGVTGGMRWFGHPFRRGLAVARRSIGPHEQRVALGRRRGSAADDGPAGRLDGMRVSPSSLMPKAMRALEGETIFGGECK